MFAMMAALALAAIFVGAANIESDSPDGLALAGNCRVSEPLLAS